MVEECVKKDLQCRMTSPATALQTLLLLECVLTPMSNDTRAIAAKPMASSVK